MDRTLAIGLAVSAGMAAAAQAPTNAGLRQALGAAQAGAISAGVTALVFLAAAFALGRGLRGPAHHVPIWQYLTGGILGALYVGALLSTVRTLGATRLLAAVVAGQLACSLVLDHLGLIGLERHPITALQIVGLIALAAGGALVLRG
jgi:transporter family-2 protein